MLRLWVTKSRGKWAAGNLDLRNRRRIGELKPVPALDFPSDGLVLQICAMYASACPVHLAQISNLPRLYIWEQIGQSATLAEPWCCCGLISTHKRCWSVEFCMAIVQKLVLCCLNYGECGMRMMMPAHCPRKNEKSESFNEQKTPALAMSGKHPNHRHENLDPLPLPKFIGSLLFFPNVLWLYI